MTDDPLCPRCSIGHLSIPVEDTDAMRKCDECGMEFDVRYISDATGD